MEFSDGNLWARLLLTLAALGYSAVPIKADFNNTHATNANWTPHARFHVVWQVLSNTGLLLLSLALIWIKGSQATERLYLAAAIGFAIYIAFFAAVLARPLFGGMLYDQNGYLPFNAPLGITSWRWDANVTAFGVATAILVAGTLLIR